MFLLPVGSWRVTQTKNKGRGIVATQKIQAGTVIGDYLGMVIKTAQYDITQDIIGLYLMYFTDQASIYPDLTKPGLHLINHSCSPNCWIYTYNRHTLFFALRTIAIGEELTISYLLSPKDAMCDPCVHVCKCDSIACTGTMHLSQEKYLKWQSFQKQQKKQTSRAIFSYGKPLNRLPAYPTYIPIDPIYSELIA